MRLINLFYTIKNLKHPIFDSPHFFSTCGTYWRQCFVTGHLVTRYFPPPFLGKQRIFLGVASILSICLCPHTCIIFVRKKYFTCGEEFDHLGMRRSHLISNHQNSPQKKHQHSSNRCHLSCFLKKTLVLKLFFFILIFFCFFFYFFFAMLTDSLKV